MVANPNITDVSVLDDYQPPPSTDTYLGIGHRYLYDAAQSIGEDLGFRLIKNNIEITNKGNRAFISLFFDTGLANLPFMVGVRSCYDKSAKVAIVSGAGIMVCSNLCAWGDMMVFRKHTPNAKDDLKNLIENMKSQAVPRYRSAIHWSNETKKRDLTDTQGKKIIGSALATGLVPHRAFLQAMEHWEKPPFIEFVGERNLWGVYNALTYGVHLTPTNSRLQTAINVTNYIKDIQERNALL